MIELQTKTRLISNKSNRMVSPAPGWWCGDRTYPCNKDDYLFKF